MARAFCALRARHKDDFGMTINPIDHPQSWGAWAAYFKEKQIGQALFRQRGMECASLTSREYRETRGFQVPAQLPSDFDEDWDFMRDKLAGDNFITAQERQRSKVKEMGQTPEERAEHVRRILGRAIRSGKPVDETVYKASDRVAKPWNDKAELAASMERINAAMPADNTEIMEDEL